MEQRTATIPFDLETAKKIKIGEIAGRIVTEKGQNRGIGRLVFCYRKST